MKKIILSVFILSVALVQISFSEQMQFAIIEWPPYSGESVNQKGFVSEIVETAWQRRGYTTSLNVFPIKRAVASTKDGLYMAMFPYIQEEDLKNEEFILSEPFAGTAIVLYRQKSDKPLQYTKLEDLKDYVFGTVLGFSYTSEFDSATYIKKDTARTDKLNFLKLAKGRIDIVIADKYVADSLFKNELADIANSIEQIDPPFSVRPIYVAFTKNHPDSAKMVEEFNAGLREVKRDGTLNNIMEKYGLFTISSKAYTRDELKQFVDSAASYIREVGVKKAFEEFRKPDGKFTKGELYIFADNMQGLNLSHINPKMQGGDHHDLKDKLGFAFMQEFIKVAQLGSGWVEYWFENPVTKKLQPKISYIKKINDDMFIGCGIYK
ncbi:MAG: transporter substrate-binding domain-containing protein [Desulfamplus sp.]|nr:transporter substrate-binding domain-containing protein [Desulfamplus sp.]MBF0412727.1 transporter substrate-binding domain-containing protein [Desulfamplus sp.]